MNLSWSRKILQELHQVGVREIIVCAGARNSPLVMVLARAEGFRLHSFFEERSGSFFALGIARRTGQPVAVITTSGTAVTELLSSAAEAFHTGVPVIYVTADRPRRLRGTGAPQAIDQVGLFSKFAAVEFDIEAGEGFSFEGWNRRAPLHLNVCFDEPLLDEPLDDDSDQWPLPLSVAPEPYVGSSPFAKSVPVVWAAVRVRKFLQSRIEQGTDQPSSEGTTLLLVGTLESEGERQAVAEFVTRLECPVYFEAQSGLRERADLQKFALQSGDQVLTWALRRGLLARVLRIGGIPTARIWRDLDLASPSPGAKVDVMSLSVLPFSGLGRGELLCAEIAATLHAVAKDAAGLSESEGAWAREAIWAKDQASAAALMGVLRGEPFSEAGLIHDLSVKINKNDFVYVGNSLPIREWDLVADREGFRDGRTAEANRGVNGIDGQVATFLGLAREGVANWAVIGDLTALYDLVGPWALMSRKGLKVRLVVVNNGGGKIFSRIFKNDLFENRHSLNFSAWAQMWGWHYQKWTEIPASCDDLPDRVIIELVPDEISTRLFWDRYDAIWS